MSRTQRLSFLAIAAAIAVVAVIVLASGGDDKTTATTTTPVATATATSDSTNGATPEPTAAGFPVLAPSAEQTLTFTEGDTIAFKVTSPTADEVHVHGYDLHKDVKAGGEVSFSFPAKITGIFEVELEGAGTKLGELRVEPK